MSTGPGGIRRARFGERLIATGHDLFTAGAERRLFGPRRRELLSGARGRVLDVGAGTGANLPHLPHMPEPVSELVLLDPSAGMLERAYRRAEGLGVPVRLVDSGAEHVPFDDETFDTVIFTLTLCTIPDPAGALREAHRILRNDGRMLVFEHVRAHETGLAKWQDRWTPLWKVINNGCHPNRDTRGAIETAGFHFEHIEEFEEARIPLRIVQPQLTGTARKNAI
jgi:ubiquinone/menaquinone biosynthesis C-methylase UbiE